MTEVHVQQGPLDAMDAMVFKDYGRRVRMAFDARRISEQSALLLLRLYLPHLPEEMRVVHRLSV